MEPIEVIQPLGMCAFQINMPEKLNTDSFNLVTKPQALKPFLINRDFLVETCVHQQYSHSS